MGDEREKLILDQIEKEDFLAVPRPEGYSRPHLMDIELTAVITSPLEYLNGSYGGVLNCFLGYADFRRAAVRLGPKNWNRRPKENLTQKPKLKRRLLIDANQQGNLEVVFYDTPPYRWEFNHSISFQTMGLPGEQGLEKRIVSTGVCIPVDQIGKYGWQGGQIDPKYEYVRGVWRPANNPAGKG